MANEDLMGGLLGNPLVAMGLGMLANNQGRYPFQSAIGGGFEGLQQASAYKRQLLKDQMMQEQMAMQKEQMAQATQEFLRKKQDQERRDKAISDLALGSKESFVAPWANPSEAVKMANPDLVRSSLAILAPEKFASSAYDNLFPEKVKPNLHQLQDGTVVDLNDPNLIGTNHAAPKEIKPNPTRERQVGRYKVFEEFDPKTMRWNEISRGSLDAPKQASASETVAVPDPSSPTGYRFIEKKVGGVAPNPAKSEGKPPTEFQSKAGLYYKSMRTASSILNKLETEGADIAPSALELATPTETGAHIMRSETRRSYVQAQKQWIDSINRVRSGANLPEIEYDRAVATFFPQYGESPARIEQKRLAREQEETAMRDAAAGAVPEDYKQVNILPKDGGVPVVKQSSMSSNGWSAKKIGGK